MFDSKIDTFLTLLLTAALAVGLSVAPVPDALRPLPELGRGDWRDALEKMVLASTHKAAAVTAIEGDGQGAASQPVEVEEEELEAASAPSSAPGPTGQKRYPGFAGEIEPERALELEALREKVGARHSDIVESCRQPLGAGSNDCRQFSLDPFFAALDAIEPDAGMPARTEPVRVVHFGDSLIASDYISDVLRRRLQKRFGPAGAGFLYVDRPSKFGGLKTRAGEATPGWQIAKIPEPLGADNWYGFAGVAFSAEGKQRSKLKTRGARSMQLHVLLQPRGGEVQVRCGAAVLLTLPTNHVVKAMKAERLALPADCKEIELEAVNARVFGAALETSSGVTLESIGLPGAYAGAYLRIDGDSFASSLQARAPTLNLIMLGGNEALRLDNEWTTVDAIEREAQQLVTRIRAATPDAACLVVSALASGVQTMGADIRVRKQTRIVSDLYKRVALAQGCAFWDGLIAQGGEGAIVKWFDSGLMNADLVHPLRRGADLLGHLLETALQRAYFIHFGPDAIADPKGLIDVSGHALDGFFAKLRKLEKTKKGQVKIVQLGASHTAGHMFTDEARAIMQARFGDAGRGFVAAGATSARLSRAKVRRSLSKGWRVRDGLTAPPGEYWGLTGIRAEGPPRGSFEMAFCDGCPPSQMPATLKIFYLEEPGMGRIDVRIDGKSIGVLPGLGLKRKEALEIREPAAAIYAHKVRGASHTVRLTNVGEAEISVFGVAQDLDRAGVRWEALGLPGSTAVVADNFDKPSFTKQLADRDADLYVLFYGTNESALSRFDPTVYRDRYLSLLDTLKTASPDAECLIMGPTDRMVPERASDRNSDALRAMAAANEPVAWREVGSLRTVITALRGVAETHGCMFWSTRAAMGGTNSIAQWLSEGDAHPDHVHLSQKGYERLARMMLHELLDSYSAYLVTAGVSRTGR